VTAGVAVAVAHPNVALSKYWGKRDGPGNYPAVPSLSVTLSGLSTRTSVRFDNSLLEDVVILNGEPSVGRVRERATSLLDRARAAAGDSRRAEVVSQNDFPTASGLASSASGFAALALAAVRAIGLDWAESRVSDLARRSSGSAARSVFGGYVVLDAAPVGVTEDCVLPAVSVAPADILPLTVLVCMTTELPKATGSTAGMIETLRRSPYASAWLEEAPRIHARLRAALLAGDFATVGELAEASSLAMHASAIAAGLVYWNGATLDLLGVVRRLRESGLEVFASVDAGPHVKVLLRETDQDVVRAAIDSVSGLKQVVRARPGPGAALESVEG
jgi:diphosphomevalonate decarboxylase